MDITAFVNRLEQLLRIGITIIFAYFIALWIACVWWTFRDIRSRTTDIFLQIAATLLVAVFSLPGLLIYVVLRPPKTLAQLYEDSLEEEAFLQGIQVHNSCPVCKQRVEPDFIFCPWCQTRLKRTCARRRPWRSCTRTLSRKRRSCRASRSTTRARCASSASSRTSSSVRGARRA